MSQTDDKKDLVEDNLRKAKEEYESSLSRSIDALLIDYDKQIKIYAASGNLEAVEAMQQDKNRFVRDKSQLPQQRSMQIPKSRYEREVRTHVKRMGASYDSAISEYTRLERYDEAKAVRSLKIQFESQSKVHLGVSEPVQPIKPKDPGVKNDEEKDGVPSLIISNHAKSIWATVRQGRKDVFYSAMLGQYDRAFGGKEPFISLTIPSGNLWSESVQKQMRGKIDLSNIGCSGTGWLIVPKDDTYVIVNPNGVYEGGIEIDGKSPGLGGGDIQLAKGYYKIKYAGGNYGRDSLSGCKVSIVHKKSKQDIPIVVSEYEIKQFIESRPDGDTIVDHPGFKLSKVTLPKGTIDELVKQLSDDNSGKSDKPAK